MQLFWGSCQTGQRVTVLWGWDFWVSSKPVLSLLIAAGLLVFTTTIVVSYCFSNLQWNCEKGNGNKASLNFTQLAILISIQPYIVNFLFGRTGSLLGTVAFSSCSVRV